MDYGLFDEFELEVKVWIPTIEDNRIKGILKYSHSDILLILEGDLFNIKSSGELESLSVPLLYGEITEGQIFNLREGNISNYNLLGRNATISFRVLEVGTHYIESDTEYVSVTYKAIGYRNWINEDYFVWNHLYDMDTNTITNDIYNIFDYEIDDKNIKSIVNLSRKTEKGGLDVKSFISINYKNHTKFDDILNDVYLFNDLLMIFQNRFVPIEKLMLTDKFGNETKVYIIQRNEANPSYHPKKMLIRFLKIENEFEKVLKKWFSDAEKINMLKSLYLADFYFDSVMDVRFMNSVQALEVYHRIFYDSVVIEKSKYKANVKQLKNAISQFDYDFDSKFLEKLYNSLSHVNRLSLKEQLYEIISSLEAATKMELFDDADGMELAIKQMVNTRNYFAHYGDSEKKYILKGLDELYDSNLRIKAVVLIILLKLLGIGEEVILEGIVNNQYYSNAIEGIKKFNSKEE